MSGSSFIGLVVKITCLAIPFAGYAWQTDASEKLRSQEQALSLARFEVSKERDRNRRLLALPLDQNSGAWPFVQSYVETEQTLRSRSRRYGISFTNVVIGNDVRAAGSAGSWVDQSKVVEGQNRARYLALTATGTYGSYSAFKQFLDELQTLPVAITALEIEDKAIKRLTIEVYGVLPN